MNVTGIVKMQMNEAKSWVRSMIVDQIGGFTKQTKHDVSAISLPSTEWLFENLLLANGMPIRKIVGTEIKPELFSIVKEKMPQNPRVKILPFDIDNLIQYDTDCNVFWADYCGSPGVVSGKGRASFPHLETFVNKVITTETPFVYFMTFCCVPRSRIKGAGKKLFKAMAGESDLLFQDAIERKIFDMLKGKIEKYKKVTRIMKIHYTGGGKKSSDMVTFGFAVNFDPTFKTYEQDWVKKVEKNVQVDAIILLKNNKWETKDIAKALNVSVAKIASILRYNGGAGFKKFKTETIEAVAVEA